jgi:hypothetical protein
MMMPGEGSEERPPPRPNDTQISCGAAAAARSALPAEAAFPAAAFACYAAPASRRVFGAACLRRVRETAIA